MKLHLWCDGRLIRLQPLFKFCGFAGNNRKICRKDFVSLLYWTLSSKFGDLYLHFWIDWFPTSDHLHLHRVAEPILVDNSIITRLERTHYYSFCLLTLQSGALLDVLTNLVVRCGRPRCCVGITEYLSGPFHFIYLLVKRNTKLCVSKAVLGEVF